MGFGALAGGIVQGWNQESDRQLRAQEAARRQKEWEDAQEIKSKVAAAQGIGVMEQASGADAMSGAQNALQIALARAETPEAKAQVEKDYAETLSALEARKETPAQFLMNGKTFASRPTDDAVASERRSATVAALGADPERAMAYEANSMKLDEQRKEQAFKAEIPAFMKTTRSAEAMATGRTPAVADSLADTAAYLALQAKHGKYDPAAWLSVSEKMQKAEDENFTKAMRKADAGAAIGEVLKEFNKSGKQTLKPENVVSDVMGTVVLRGQKIPTRIITVKDEAGNERQINVAAELSALGETKELLANHFAGKADKRGDAQLSLSMSADSRAQTTHELGLPAAQAGATLATLRTAYSGEEDPAKKAKILDRINALQATGGADKDAPAEVKLANAFRRSGLAKSDAEALKMATTTKDMSPEKMRFELMKSALTTTMGNVKRANAIVDEAMSSLGSGSAPPPSQADFEATAKKHGITVEEVKRRLANK